jgi:hypothetical protein
MDKRETPARLWLGKQELGQRDVSRAEVRGKNGGPVGARQVPLQYMPDVFGRDVFF